MTESGAGNSGSAQKAQPGAISSPPVGSLILAGLAIATSNTYLYGVDLGYVITDNNYTNGYTGGALAYYVVASSASFNPQWQWDSASVWATEQAEFAPIPASGVPRQHGGTFR